MESPQDVRLTNQVTYICMSRAHFRISLGLLIVLCGSPISAEVSQLNIFTWREDTAAQLIGAVPMISVRVSYYGGNVPLGIPGDSARPARDVAREAASDLKQRDPAHRAILLFGIGVASGPRGEPSLYPVDDRNIEAYGRGGLIDFTRRWSTEFWQTLAELGVTPSLIVLDYEDGSGFWGLKQDFTRVAGSPATAPDWAAGSLVALERLQKFLGVLPGGYAPIDFVNENQHWGFNRGAVTSFNEWQEGRRARAIRASIIQPAWETFHSEIPASNFGEQKRAWAGADVNDWPISPGPISGSWSSPCTYLGIAGQRYSIRYKTKNKEFRRALSWLDRRNDVRAALAVTRDVAPWYSNPDYGRDADQDLKMQRLQWAAGLLHDRAVGVNVLLFWSDRAWTDDEIKFAQPILAYLRTMPIMREVEIGKLSESQPEETLKQWVQLAAKLSSR